MSRADFRSLREVLDRAAGSGRSVRLWWRDDDAVRHTPALDRLFELGRWVGVPIAVAAIPCGLHESLAERLGREPGARALVHGWRHANHEGSDKKRAEFGDARAPSALSEEAGQALAAIRSSFGNQALDVFVPPWNRVSPALPGWLAKLGYQGISTFGPRGTERRAGLAIVNTHLDPVDWRRSGGAVGERALSHALARAILDAADPVEPIGLLTHHLRFDDDLWSFTARLVEALAAHPAVRPVGLGELWPSEERH